MADSAALLQSIKQQHYEISKYIQQQAIVTDRIIHDVQAAYHNDTIFEANHGYRANVTTNLNEQNQKLHFPALNRVLKSHAKRTGKEFRPLEFEIPIPTQINPNNPATQQLQQEEEQYYGACETETYEPVQPTSLEPPQRKPPQPPQMIPQKDKREGRQEERREDERHDKLLTMARRTSAAITIQRAWRGSIDFRRYVAQHRIARAHRKRVVMGKLLATWHDYVEMRKWWKARWNNLVKCWGIKNIHLHLGREFPVTYLTMTEGKYVMAARYHAWRSIRKFFLKWQFYMASNE